MTIPVKKSQEARYNLDPASESFFVNRFQGRRLIGFAIKEVLQFGYILDNFVTVVDNRRSMVESDFYTKLKKLDVQEGKKYKLFADHDTGMRSAQSGDCVLPPAGARRHKANHRGIEGEHWAKCARVRRQRKERTLVKRQSWGPSNDGRPRMVNWESQSKTPPQSPEDGQ